MRIAVISTPIFKMPCVGYAGLEHLAWQIADGLGAKGHEVTLIAPDGSQCPHAKIFPIGSERSLGEKEAYGKYWQLLATVDCVIDHSWSKWAYIGKAEGWLNKIPVLGVMHAPVNSMYRVLPPKVDKPCFVCISQDQANHFQALFSREAKVAHNGVDPDVYKPLGLPRSDRFLFLARFSSIKGPDISQDIALATNTGLDMVGDTSITNEPELLQQCQQKADGKQIKMIGPASRGSCVWWFSQAYCLSHMNQRFREPYGLAPVEAQLCETPVLAWNNGAMRETVKHGETGFLINSIDDAIQIIKSGAINGINRKLCREWASQFSVQKMVDRYEQLCLEAISTGGW